MGTPAFENPYRVSVPDHDQFDTFHLRHGDAILGELGFLGDDKPFV
jgi:hypothetical protein